MFRKAKVRKLRKWINEILVNSIPGDQEEYREQVEAWIDELEEFYISRSAEVQSFILGLGLGVFLTVVIFLLV